MPSYDDADNRDRARNEEAHKMADAINKAGHPGGTIRGSVGAVLGGEGSSGSGGGGGCARLSTKALIEQRVAELRRSADRLERLGWALPNLDRSDPMADEVLFSLILNYGPRF